MGTSELAPHVSATAVDLGRTCALAVRCQRDLQKCAATHRELFPAEVFDSAFFSALSLTTAFCSPWETAERLTMVNKAALWVFALDRLVDTVATSGAEIARIERDCLTVAGGTTSPAGTPLGRLLAEVRAELAGAPGFDRLHPVWERELRRMLSAMAREWRWSAKGALDGAPEPPTFDEYLDNADSFGSAFVNVSHWIFTGDARTEEELARLSAAGGEVQRYLRLLNDLATHRRELVLGDLNVLGLGVGRAKVTERMAGIARRARELIDALRPEFPRPAEYLDLQIGYNVGFYGGADYWGDR
jgi:hypothetical protein